MSPPPQNCLGFFANLFSFLNTLILAPINVLYVLERQ